MCACVRKGASHVPLFIMFKKVGLQFLSISIYFITYLRRKHAQTSMHACAYLPGIAATYTVVPGGSRARWSSMRAASVGVVSIEKSRIIAAAAEEAPMLMLRASGAPPSIRQRGRGVRWCPKEEASAKGGWAPPAGAPRAGAAPDAKLLRADGDCVAGASEHRHRTTTARPSTRIPSCGMQGGAGVHTRRRVGQSGRHS